jgi:tagaturonate reductase
MILSKENLQNIPSGNFKIPGENVFDLPEKILQFGTGALLRALPDYFVDKANREGVFNGRIVVVKSTQTGDTDAFNNQNGLYTLVVRGVEQGIQTDGHVISSSISRVLSASHQWKEILSCAANPELQIIISNTTEVGIQLVKESIREGTPVSFPGKLLAFLQARYQHFKGSPESGMLVIPTELLTDNGKKLKEIVTELALFNGLDRKFMEWLEQQNRFCNSLVDRIVPGKPGPAVKQELEKQWGYEDELAVVCEPYRLWAIEGDEPIRKTLSFSGVDEGVIIAPDITKYKELKLRLLNATHTLSCGLAFLSGFKTVRLAMSDGLFSSYIANLMMDEIGPAIPYKMGEDEIRNFGMKVLDRFRNPYLEHQWLSITMQYSSKLGMRVLPVLHTYYERFRKTPELIAKGFAAYLLFMRPVKKEGDKYYGILGNQYYLINDDRAEYFYGLWEEGSIDHIVGKMLANKELWNTDLNELSGFTESVTRQLKEFIRFGTLTGIAAYAK